MNYPVFARISKPGLATVAMIASAIPLCLPNYAKAEDTKPEMERVQLLEKELAALKKEVETLRQKSRPRSVIASQKTGGSSAGGSSANEAHLPSRSPEKENAFRSSYAADMPVYSKVPQTAALNNWTGFYVGGNVGHVWQDRTTVNYAGNDPMADLLLNGLLGGGAGQRIPPTSFNLKGVSGGIQAGYNWQANSNWLIGIETDFNSGAKGSGSTAFTFTPGDPGTLTVERNVDWFGTVRVRAGWLATSNWLLYATGGLAYGRITDRATIVQAIDTFGNAFGFSFLCAANAPCYSGASSRTSAGWTGGAGTETMVTKNLSLKIEYLYVNLGGGSSYNITAIPQALPGLRGASISMSNPQTDFHTVRVGLNYKFDGLNSVVAKY